MAMLVSMLHVCCSSRGTILASMTVCGMTVCGMTVCGMTVCGMTLCGKTTLVTG